MWRRFELACLWNQSFSRLLINLPSSWGSAELKKLTHQWAFRSYIVTCIHILSYTFSVQIAPFLEKNQAFCINNYCVGNYIANYLWLLFSLIFHEYLWHESLKFSPVASLLSWCETCEIRLLFKELNPYFCKFWHILYGETNDKVFTNFNPGEPLLLTEIS